MNFSVMPGEVIGIIGRNGAGKSTLLKILSQITPPTSGSAHLRGRVASLLEVGTGFHQELTGRENIFLNGAILGMTQREIAKKFDEIVDFSGVEKFLDTPVKRYSSGMHVRLAFAVAAHLEPEILVIDEVLAVGDAEFQKKCLGKMGEVAKAGRTVLFVSHNMNAIQDLCKRSMLLENGEIIKDGKTSEVISFYLNKEVQNAVRNYTIDKNKIVQIHKISILNKDLKPSASLSISEDFFIEVEYEFFKPEKNLLFSIIFYSGDGLLLYTSESDKKGATNDYEVGRYSTTIKIPAFTLNIGYFHFDAAIHSASADFDHKDKINFEIININNPKSRFRPNYELGKTAYLLDYTSAKIN
ncbi:MAG: ABC transporter ATP-binding protein [Candidatus Moranbacteria bacterium]|nr:ABC transporter ATP-binding protein [Candidatus Moranbacteria bacterium]